MIRRAGRCVQARANGRGAGQFGRRQHDYSEGVGRHQAVYRPHVFRHQNGAAHRHLLAVDEDVGNGTSCGQKCGQVGPAITGAAAAAITAAGRTLRRFRLGRGRPPKLSHRRGSVRQPLVAGSAATAGRVRSVGGAAVPDTRTVRRPVPAPGPDAAAQATVSAGRSTAGRRRRTAAPVLVRQAGHVQAEDRPRPVERPGQVRGPVAGYGIRGERPAKPIVSTGAVTLKR